MSIRSTICPEDRHVERQIRLFELQPGNPMFGRAPQQVPVRRPAEITGLVHNSGRMLPRINTLFALPALCDLVPDALDARKKLWLVVERGHRQMAPLPPRRVIAVVMDNKAPDTVVLRLNSAHGPKANPRHRHPKASQAQHRSALVTSDIDKRETSLELSVEYRFLWPPCWPSDPADHVLRRPARVTL